MAAILGLDAALVAQACAEAANGEVVSAANLNGGGQIAIAGGRDAVARAGERAKALGAKRVIPLAVSAPFHCALMKPAQERLASALDAAHFADLRVPLVNNWQAREVRTGADARTGLYEQIPNPVRWTDCMRHLAACGVNRYIEAGPGNVLAGLLRSIVPGAVCEAGL